MQLPEHSKLRYFVSYSGVKLPLNVVNEIDAAQVENRNTYFCGYYDELDRMVACEKRVYGEVEFVHHYVYHPSGRLQSAHITMLDDESQYMEFPDG